MSTTRHTQTTYRWCGYTHDGQCGPGACPSHVKLRKGRKMKCGCISHDPVDHQGACGHCGAAEDEPCSPGCPVEGGQPVERQADSEEVDRG